MKKVIPVSSTLLHNTDRLTGLPSATVANTIALGSATPSRSASSIHLRNNASQPSASQSASRSGLPSASTDPYSDAHPSAGACRRLVLPLRQRYRGCYRPVASARSGVQEFSS